MDIRQTLQASLADRYTIEREIGVGGMATVYLARDLRHDRQVALKVLKPELGAVLGVERFLAEIRVTANLQHPHLLPLFDSGEAQGLLFYVMPFVAGESLRQRLERDQQLSIAESVRIATAVASALDYAHRHQVVHRDLKPENILMQDGEPLVSDFGIALAVSNAGGARITQTGLSLGTPAYMSPEQAGGDRVVDARSDVYSLAAVLYEMLIGEPPHTGANVQQVISRVLTERPRNLTEQRHTIPHWLEDAVLRALAKLPADRYPTARAFGEALKSGDAHPVTASGPRAVAQRPARSTWLAWGLAGAASISAAWLAFRPAPSPELPPLVRFAVAPPNGLRSDFVELALSADGRRMLIGEGGTGSRRVWLRRLGDDDMTEVPGLSTAQSLFLSPDGSSIGFVSEGRIKTMPSGGGTVATIGEADTRPMSDAPSWGSRGLVAYAGPRDAGLWAVSLAGGAPQRLTTPDSGSHDAAVSFLPDGEHFVFERRSGPQGTAATLMLGKVGAPERPLGDLKGSTPQFVSGYLFFGTEDGTVQAVPLDDAWQPQGTPLAVITMTTTTRGPRRHAFVASHSGVFAFLEAAPRAAEIVVVDRDGTARAVTGSLRDYGTPVASPVNGDIAAEVINADGTSDIQVFGLEGGARRITRGGRNQSPVFSPDGRSLAWVRSGDQAESQVVVQRLDRPDSARTVFSGRGMIRLHAFTANGDSLRGVILAPRARPDLVAIDLATGGLGHYHSEDGERSASVSPSGAWVTYTAAEDGVTQVFVRPSATAGPVVRISERGGEQPHWGSQGNTVFYRDSTHLVEAVLAPGAVPTVARRLSLFVDPYERAGLSAYDAATNGSFVFLRTGAEAAHIDVLVNVAALVRSRATVARRAVASD